MLGSCNCSNIKYSSDGAVVAVVNCHCKLCRKMNGSAFSTYIVVPAAECKLTQGKLQSVKVSANASKFFCPACGTPIYNENSKLKGFKILYLGSLDMSDNIYQPTINIYCESQLLWTTKLDSFKNLEQGIEQ